MGVYRPRVIREGPTTADVYIDISPFYGMAPATVVRVGIRSRKIVNACPRSELHAEGGRDSQQASHCTQR